MVFFCCCLAFCIIPQEESLAYNFFDKSKYINVYIYIPANPCTASIAVQARRIPPGCSQQKPNNLFHLSRVSLNYSQTHRRSIDLPYSNKHASTYSASKTSRSHKDSVHVDSDDELGDGESSADGRG